MKEVLLEIWIENKWHPGLMLAKFFLIFALLFAGALLRGFPYSIVFFYVVFSLDMVLLIAPRIDFFLPRSREEWCRMKRKKCLLVSVFYAGIAAGGYLLNVAVTERYHFDFVHVSAIWIMFSLFFLIMLENRLELERTRYEEDMNVLEKRDKNKLMTNAVSMGFSVILSNILLILLCIVDFAEVDALLILQQRRFRVVEWLLYIGLMSHCLYMVHGSWKKLKAHYMDN